MDFTRNIQFSLLIPVNGRLREFNFLRRNPELYEADIADESGDRYYFRLLKQNEQWRINGIDLPLWLRRLEELVDKAVINWQTNNRALSGQN